MTTTLYINSLIRYDPDTCRQLEPNPFEFTVPSRETSKWAWKKTPHSPNAFRGVGGFEATLDALVIPVSVMPVPEPFVMYEVSGRSNIDTGNMTRVMANNNLCQQVIENCNCGVTMVLVSCKIGATGVTGFCLQTVCGITSLGCTGVTTAITYAPCENSKKSNLNNTWIAHYVRDLKGPTGEILYYLYKSKSSVSVRDEAWIGSMLEVKILDSTGMLLIPPGLDCDNPCTYARFFCKENQVNATFSYQWIPYDSNIGPKCFNSNK